MARRRIIIDNRSSHPDHIAAQIVAAVIGQGCMMADGSGYAPVRMRDDTFVSTFRNKDSDRFVIIDGGRDDSGAEIDRNNL